MQEKTKDLEYILQIFPELAWIKDQDMVEKVKRIWLRAWRESTWESPEDCPLNPELPMCSLIEHVRYVTQGVRALAEVRESQYGEKLNMDLLITAALLHDVSKLLEFESVDGETRWSLIGERLQHAFYSAVFALDEGMPLDLVHIILTHSSHSKKYPQTREGVLLYYVDFSDADIARLSAGKPLYVAQHKR